MIGFMLACIFIDSLLRRMWRARDEETCVPQKWFLIIAASGALLSFVAWLVKPK